MPRMSRPRVIPTGREITFGEDEIIVSKTDLKGKITYANEVFQRVSGYSEQELLGQPHNLIRHPAMPRCVFKLLWETVQSGSEIFAYVVNMAKNGDSYWVFAHVTPTFDADGRIIGYHSNRRVPDRASIETIKPVYELLAQEESKYSDPRQALEASCALLNKILEGKNIQYEEFVFAV